MDFPSFPRPGPYRRLKKQSSEKLPVENGKVKQSHEGVLDVKKCSD